MEFSPFDSRGIGIGGSCRLERKACWDLIVGRGVGTEWSKMGLEIMLVPHVVR